MNGYFLFGSNTEITAPASFENGLFKELWNGFSFSASEAVFKSGKDNRLFIGKEKEIALGGNECAVEVDEDGVNIAAVNGTALVDGYCKLLSMIRPIELEKGKEQLCIEKCRIELNKKMERKMIHICVFPETALFFLRRLIRLSGFLRYTHVILEFWGTYKFKCLPSLAWSDKSYSYEQIRPIIDEAIAFGMEVIPDFNHLGHASSSRILIGKHTVLDQDPRSATLFSDDGWAWNLDNPKVRPLLKEIRRELCELCGDSEYFHLGCDECYTYAEDKKKMIWAADYLADICREVLSEGRRTIIWGDMLLRRETVGYNETDRYSCNCHDETVERYIIDKLPKETVIADWQYNIPESVWNSTKYFMENGFDTLCCPWEHVGSAMDTVEALGAYGLMETTWHHLSSMMYQILLIDVRLNEPEAVYSSDVLRARTATLLRKLSPAHSYEQTGWARNQLEFY